MCSLAYWTSERKRRDAHQQIVNGTELIGKGTPKKKILQHISNGRRTHRGHRTDSADADTNTCSTVARAFFLFVISIILTGNIDSLGADVCASEARTPLLWYISLLPTYIHVDYVRCRLLYACLSKICVFVGFFQCHSRSCVFRVSVYACVARWAHFRWLNNQYSLLMREARTRSPGNNATIIWYPVHVRIIYIYACESPPPPPTFTFRHTATRNMRAVTTQPHTLARTLLCVCAYKMCILYTGLSGRCRYTYSVYTRSSTGVKHRTLDVGRRFAQAAPSVTWTCSPFQPAYRDFCAASASLYNICIYKRVSVCVRMHAAWKIRLFHEK